MHSVREQKVPGICQECKRLKIRCSRTIPCDQCVRRGVEDVCPDGRLTTGRTGRYVLTSAKELHDENKALKIRIRELEKALEESSHQNPLVHPLLEPNLLSLARSHNVEDTPKPTNEDPLLNNFGTIRLNNKGKDRWLGATALSEVHLDIHDKDDDFEPLMEEHAKFAVPFSMLYPPSVFLSMAHGNLPPKEEAWSLLETFYEHAIYAYQFNSREDFIARIFSPAYSGDISKTSAYKLASLYAVLALGALHDLSRPIYAPETREWMEVAQSLMTTTFGEWETTIDSIEAVVILCCIFPARPELELSKTYYQTSWAMKMAQSVGLHRDPKDLGLDEDACTRRRRLFTELRLVDATESLLYGRPFTMNSQFVSSGATSRDDQLDDVMRFKRDMINIMEEVADLFMGRGSAYSDIMKTDSKLRGLQPQNLPGGTSSTSGALRQFMCSIWYHSTLLTLHRTHFAFAAMKSASENRSGAKFAPSVIASYEASTNLVQATISFTKGYPRLLARTGFIWPHIFTCMVVLYSFGIHTPRWTKTKDALLIADECISSVYLPSIECIRAKQTMPYLSMLRERAHSTVVARTTNGSAETSQESAAIPGLSTGIAVQTSEIVDYPFHYKMTKAEELLAGGRGARGLAFRHAALKQAQDHLFGEQAHFITTQPVNIDTSLQLPFDTSLLGDISNTSFDTDAFDSMNWSWNPDDSSYGSSPEQVVSQLDLQSAWADFLLKL